MRLCAPALGVLTHSEGRRMRSSSRSWRADAPPASAVAGLETLAGTLGCGIGPVSKDPRYRKGVAHFVRVAAHS